MVHRIGRCIALAFGGMLLLTLLSVMAINLLWFGLYLSYKRQAETYISEIEKFKIEHGYFPDKTKQTIVPELSPFFYDSNGRQFCVGFSIGFDNVYSYCSATQGWTDGLAGPISSDQTEAPQ